MNFKNFFKAFKQRRSECRAKRTYVREPAKQPAIAKQKATLVLCNSEETIDKEFYADIPAVGDTIVYEGIAYKVSSIAHMLNECCTEDSKRIYAECVETKATPTAIRSIYNDAGKRDKRILRIIKNAKYEFKLYEVVCTALMEMHNNPSLSIYDALQIGADKYIPKCQEQ